MKNLFIKLNNITHYNLTLRYIVTKRKKEKTIYSK